MAENEKEPFLLKDMFSKERIAQLTQCLIELEILNSSEYSNFINLVIDANWANLSLNERVNHIAHCLQKYLGTDFEAAAPKLNSICKWYLNSGVPKQNYICQFIPHYLLLFGNDYSKTSLSLIETITELTSCEFAIRPLLIKYQEATLKQMQKWTQHPSENVRRLASEGCRPRLPWGLQLKEFVKDPTPLFPILTKLIDDESTYVRKSIANHLNDISKDHPEKVIAFCKGFLNGKKHRTWIAEKGLRTLLKSGNKEALKLFNWEDLKVKSASINLSKSAIRIGDFVEIISEILLENPAEKIRIELIIHYPRHLGGVFKKTFQWQQINTITQNWYATKTLKFENLSTRKLVSGTHTLELILNGKSVAKTQLQVL